MERIERRQPEPRRDVKAASGEETIPAFLRDLAIIVAGFLAILALLRFFVAALAR